MSEADKKLLQLEASLVSPTVSRLALGMAIAPDRVAIDNFIDNLMTKEQIALMADLLEKLEEVNVVRKGQ